MFISDSNAAPAVSEQKLYFVRRVNKDDVTWGSSRAKINIWTADIHEITSLTTGTLTYNEYIIATADTKLIPKGDVNLQLNPLYGIGQVDYFYYISGSGKALFQGAILTNEIPLSSTVSESHAGDYIHYNKSNATAKLFATNTPGNIRSRC